MLVGIKKVKYSTTRVNKLISAAVTLLVIVSWGSICQAQQANGNVLVSTPQKMVEQWLTHTGCKLKRHIMFQATAAMQ